MDELYKTLPCGHRDIRLLRISDRTSYEEGIHCNLQVHNLDDETFEFKALSYCWGAEEASRTIWIDAVVYKIRPNLHEFFLQFREDGDTSWIFVDAVCINRANDAERSKQVPLMGDVYRNATEVVAWLEPLPSIPNWLLALWIDLCNFGNAIVESEMADLLQSRMMKTSRQVREIKFQGGTEDDYERLIWQWSLESGASWGTEQWFCASGNEYMDSTVYFAVHFLLIAKNFLPTGFLNAFCGNKYWVRLWVVPEMVLARKLLFQVGSLGLDWRALLLFIDLWTEETGLADGSNPREARKAWNDNKDDISIQKFDPRDSMLHSAITNYYMLALSAIREPGHGSAFCLHLSKAILRWKRRMQRKARQRCVPLYEAFLGSGLQRCSVPHDASYGMIGLSPSRLQVDYEMPVLELRIRTLIDVVASISQICHRHHIPRMMLQVIAFTFLGISRHFSYLTAITIVARATNSPLTRVGNESAVVRGFGAPNLLDMFTNLGRICDSVLYKTACGNKSKGNVRDKGEKLDRKLNRQKAAVQASLAVQYIKLCMKANLPLKFGQRRPRSARHCRALLTSPPRETAALCLRFLQSRLWLGLSGQGRTQVTGGCEEGCRDERYDSRVRQMPCLSLGEGSGSRSLIMFARSGFKLLQVSLSQAGTFGARGSHHIHAR